LFATPVVTLVTFTTTIVVRTYVAVSLNMKVMVRAMMVDKRLLHKDEGHGHLQL
jgi:hypothetical protein